MERYIIAAAAERGIDPRTAVRVARSEGLARGVWQSNVKRGGRREPSYGPFQLLVGGKGTGFPAGMGNDFMRSTGLDPSDPANWKATVDFALNRASKGGWSPWYGAAKVGINRMDGIGRGAVARPVNTTASQPVRTSQPQRFDPSGWQLRGVPVQQAPESRNALGPVIVHTPSPNNTFYDAPPRQNALRREEPLPAHTLAQLERYRQNPGPAPSGVVVGGDRPQNVLRVAPYVMQGYQMPELDLMVR